MPDSRSPHQVTSLKRFRVNRQPAPRISITTANLHAFHQNAIAGRLQIQIVANVHHSAADNPISSAISCGILRIRPNNSPSCGNRPSGLVDNPLPFPKNFPVGTDFYVASERVLFLATFTGLGSAGAFCSCPRIHQASPSNCSEQQKYQASAFQAMRPVNQHGGA